MNILNLRSSAMLCTFMYASFCSRPAPKPATTLRFLFVPGFCPWCFCLGDMGLLCINASCKLSTVHERLRFFCDQHPHQWQAFSATFFCSTYFWTVVSCIEESVWTADALYRERLLRWQAWTRKRKNRWADALEIASICIYMPSCILY